MTAFREADRKKINICEKNTPRSWSQRLPKRTYSTIIQGARVSRRFWRMLPLRFACFLTSRRHLYQTARIAWRSRDFRPERKNISTPNFRLWSSANGTQTHLKWNRIAINHEVFNICHINGNFRQKSCQRRRALNPHHVTAPSQHEEVTYLG